MARDDEQEQTFLIPLSVSTRFEVFGMNWSRLRWVLVWAIVAGIVWISTDGQPVKVQYGIPFVIVALGFVFFGWGVAEDGRTMWEQWRLERAFKQQQKLFFYRKEGV